MRGHPVDFSPLRKHVDGERGAGEHVDGKRGAGTRDGWLWAVRPVLLLGTAALAAAAACALNGWRVGAPPGAYVIAGSCLSAAGLGLGLCRTLLHWRGERQA